MTISANDSMMFSLIRTQEYRDGVGTSPKGVGASSSPLNPPLNWYRHKFSGNRIAIFFRRGHLPKKPHFRGFGDYISDAPAQALAFRPMANLSIASYSRRVRNVCTLCDFFVQLTVFKTYGCNVAPNFGNFSNYSHISVVATGPMEVLHQQ